MTRISGVHHIAISTADMKGQIAFFSRVLGLELVALYWMHGAEGAWHAFMKLNDSSLLGFVFMPANRGIVSTAGITHAGHMGGQSAPGTLQHISFNVGSMEDLLALRDRIRGEGVPAFGPYDHGMCQSLYFAGPESLILEVATSAEAIDPDEWIDPEVLLLAGISAEDLQDFRHPRPTGACGGAVPQPAFDPAKPHLGFPKPVYEKMLAASDEKLARAMSMSEPPVPKAKAASGD